MTVERMIVPAAGMKLAIVLITVCCVGCVNSLERVSEPIEEGMTRYEVRQLSFRVQLCLSASPSLTFST